MQILINISDVRKYRQLGKQINTDNFNGHVRAIQENQLTELIGSGLAYKFFDFIDNGFTNLTGIFTYISVNSFKALASDLSLLSGNALKINSDIFVICETAIYDGTDTVLTVKGYELPTTISNIGFNINTDYVNLLNGKTYTDSGNTVFFTGLRPFLVWNLLISLINDNNLKQSDVGNVSILGDNFALASTAQLNMARSEYQQNANRESNRIINYINSVNLSGASTQSRVNTISTDFFII